MSDLICGKAAVGGNYNSTRDIHALDTVHGSNVSHRFLKSIVIISRMLSNRSMMDRIRTMVHPRSQKCCTGRGNLLLKKR